MKIRGKLILSFTALVAFLAISLGIVSSNDDNVGNLTNLVTPNKNNIVGAINSVVESGSNNNGSWIKYSDGTMICYKRKSGNTGQPFNLWSNSIYFFDISNGDWSIPFKTLNNIQVSSTRLQMWCICGEYSSTSAGTTRLIRPDDGGSSQAYIVDIIGIGTWK